MNVRMMARAGSKAAKEIRKAVGIEMYTGKHNKADLLVNYGLAGKYLDAFLKKKSSARNIPTLNKWVGRSKYGAIKDAEKIGILVPDSVLTLPVRANKEEWIEKKIHSRAGKGIKFAGKARRIEGKYFQRFIRDRRYELRVHAFLWMNDGWVVQKRLGPKDEIAWNFHQGGHFSTVMHPNAGLFAEAQEIAKKVLECRNMAFGAVDFVVDMDRKIYFLEVNSAPGFTNLSGPIYTNAFGKLTQMKFSDVRSLAR